MYLTRLVNSGSNCYLNSTLQGISSCPELIKDFKNLYDTYSSVDTLKVFNNLLDALTDGKQSEINARQNELFKNWKKIGQQDSFELLSYMITEIYEKLRKERKDINWFQVPLPLRIIFKHEIRCCKGHIAQCPKQVYLALHLPIPNKFSDYSIKNLLEKFMEESEIEDYICDECNLDDEEKLSTQRTVEKNATKLTNILKPLPNTICIHLQRTRWCNGSMRKINDKIKIDEEIQIKYKTDDNKNGEQPYYLKSVIVHSGTPFFGHYICYKKVGNAWFYTSDKSIKLLETKSVPDCQAYILFYEQKEHRETISQMTNLQISGS